MIDKYIEAGDKVEIQAVTQEMTTGKDAIIDSNKVYRTQVYDVISDDEVELEMPMEKTKLVLLPVEGIFDLFFYGKSGLYQCLAKITDRYKRENVFVVRMELITNLRKHQRREFYRFSCILEMKTRPLEEEEIVSIQRSRKILVPGLPLKKSIVVDISGGGLRFIAGQAYEKDTLIYCKYQLYIDGRQKEYDIVCKVRLCKEIENRPGDYEHRVEYVNLDNITREEIIRYIFEEERKNRQREKG